MDTTPQNHSPEFIAEMKQRLETERDELKGKLANLGHVDDGEFKADFPEYGRDEEENATEVGDYQATVSTTDTLEARLREVEYALEQVRVGSYGVTTTGEVIPEDRLRANPAATTLVNPGK